MSGLPSAVLGAGAARFGFPSGSRGMPAVGYLCHCGADDADITKSARIIAKELMTILLGSAEVPRLSLPLNRNSN